MRLLRKVAVVDDLPAARALVAALPDISAVTKDGDLLSEWFSSGGSSAKPSLIEIQAAVDEASERLVAAHNEVERVGFALAAAKVVLDAAAERSEAALARLSGRTPPSALAESSDASADDGRRRLEAERFDAAIAKAEASGSRTPSAWLRCSSASNSRPSRPRRRGGPAERDRLAKASSQKR